MKYYYKGAIFKSQRIVISCSGKGVMGICTWVGGWGWALFIVHHWTFDRIVLHDNLLTNFKFNKVNTFFRRYYRALQID